MYIHKVIFILYVRQINKAGSVGQPQATPNEMILFTLCMAIKIAFKYYI